MVERPLAGGLIYLVKKIIYSANSDSDTQFQLSQNSALNYNKMLQSSCWYRQTSVTIIVTSQGARCKIRT